MGGFLQQFLLGNYLRWDGIGRDWTGLDWIYPVKGCVSKEGGELMARLQNGREAHITYPTDRQTLLFFFLLSLVRKNILLVSPHIYPDFSALSIR
jgi:hypothetical protein